MNNKRIKVTLYNRTYKEIDMSDFTCLPEELFANRDDIVEVVLPEGVKVDPTSFKGSANLTY